MSIQVFTYVYPFISQYNDPSTFLDKICTSGSMPELDVYPTIEVSFFLNFVSTLVLSW